MYLLSEWRWSPLDFGRAAPTSRKSLPSWGKHECLEVGNYGVGDTGMGEIRVSRLGQIDESSEGSSECSSTRTAHAEDTPARPRTSAHSEVSRQTRTVVTELPAGTQKAQNLQKSNSCSRRRRGKVEQAITNVFPVTCEKTSKLWFGP